MTAFAGEQQLVAVGTGRGVEVRAERRELSHPIGPFGHEHPDRLDVAQSRARGERVGEVQLRRIGLGQRRGDATLRVAGRRERQLALGQHDRRQALTRGLQRGRETGDAAPEHENVDHTTSLGGRDPDEPDHDEFRRARLARNPCASKRGSSRSVPRPAPRVSGGCARRRARSAARSRPAPLRRTTRT